MDAMRKNGDFIPEKWFSYFDDNVVKRSAFYVVDERTVVGKSGVVYHNGSRPEHGRRVNLNRLEFWEGECQCGEWQQRGIICVHGYKLAKHLKVDEEHNDFLEWCFPYIVHRSRLQKLYKPEMQMVIPPLDEIEPNPIFALNAPNILSVSYLRLNLEFP